MKKSTSKKHTKKTYGKKRGIVVFPENREEDVLYFLITGCLKGGRSLDGVEWVES